MAPNELNRRDYPEGRKLSRRVETPTASDRTPSRATAEHERVDVQIPKVGTFRSVPIG